MSTPIEHSIDTDDSYPNKYMFSCGLCSKKVFSSLRRIVIEERNKHEAETAHNVSFIRGKLPKPRPCRKKEPVLMVDDNVRCPFCGKWRGTTPGDTGLSELELHIAKKHPEKP